MNERGFTLAELLVSIAVIGMVMAGVFILQQQGQLAYLWGTTRVEVQQNARLALDLMTRELRSALSLSAVGTCSDATNGSNTITFTDASNKTVIYALSGAAVPYVLQRSYDGANTDVIGGVVSFKIFCYTSDGYTLTATVADVRSVQIQVQTQTEAPASSSSVAAQRAILESRVKLRNL